MAFNARHLGDSINGSPHSVCVHLPTMADVIAYEEKDPKILAAFQSGYPRFFQNPILRDLSSLLATRGSILEGDPLLPDIGAAASLCTYAGIPSTQIREHGAFYSVALSEDPKARKRCAEFLQHTGAGLSSREAEGLLAIFTGASRFPEERRSGTAEQNSNFIREALHSVYGTHSPTDIFLFRSGMNAFYAGFQAIQQIQEQQERHIWIQLGWIYVDTARILEKFQREGTSPIKIHRVDNLEELEDVLYHQGSLIAGIVSEVPTNPLVQTPDMDALRALARKYKVALLLDPTLVSPHNVHVLPYSDIHINSLTKYAAAEADVMMGALALNAESPFYDDLYPLISGLGSHPGEGDLARMAFEIKDYSLTIRTINSRTPVIAEFLEGHPAVKEVYWAYRQPSGYNYRWLQHHANGPGGIISIVLKKNMSAFYNRCHFAKSPSFGARFTMMCPFIYLAHYDWVKSDEGRQRLLNEGLDPELIRISVGMEPVDQILEELQRCL